MIWQNWKIKASGSLSELLLEMGLDNFQTFSHWLRHLDYGRNSNRHDFSLVITEQKGTCSSKHGLFKAVALEQDYAEFDLIMGIYKMNPINTPGIELPHSTPQLKYIPEAHTYIRWQEETFDFTNASSDFSKLKDDILIEEIIQPEQINNYKPQRHKDFIKSWLLENQNLDLDFDQIWSIRENCIQQLSQL